MIAEPATYELPETMRPDACDALDKFIRAAPDQQVHLDGKNVQSFSGLAAQTIAAHQKLRAGTEHEVMVIVPSQELVAALTQLGLESILDNDRGTG